MCYNGITRQYYHKCVHSNVYYEQDDVFDSATQSHVLSSVSTVCKSDPHVYQACGFTTKITANSSFLCGGYFSTDTTNEAVRFVECDQECVAGVTTGSNTSTYCDDKCDTPGCEDESHCNGYSYGVNCSGGYVPLTWICDGWGDNETCYYNEDERDCGIINNTTNNTTNNTPIQPTCLHYWRKAMTGMNRSVPILNYTRCGVFDLTNTNQYPYCYNFEDQTNCTDPTRVGGFCFINGFMSSVSKYVVCDSALITTPVNLCDDGLDTECVSPSETTECVVHKHKLCDGVRDCTDGSDESRDICSRTTAGYFQCARSFNSEKYLDIPVSWILDNQTDCTNGEDELNSDHWRFCGGADQGTYRVLLGNNTCQDVFLCAGEGRYVEFDHMCDGLNSCANENVVCTTSRDFPNINTTVVMGNTLVRDLCRSADGACHIKEFKSGDVFGVTTKLKVPTSKVDCSRLFGEYYVFLSCMDLCLGSTCPLPNTPLNSDSCPGQFPDRIYTLANNTYLTFVTMAQTGEYDNNYYQCGNSRCVQYSRVCDLVDDCGDMSDERNCSNHMVCRNTENQPGIKEHLISLSQKCDGIYDCFDLSDECNQTCGKQILDHWILKLVCWFMGILAALLNGVTVYKEIISLLELRTKTSSTLVMYNKALVGLIGCGDFLIGVYLIGLSIYDSVIFGNEYCGKQAEWLTGTACSVLGIISTVGSQVSLFAMTTLSVVRMAGIFRRSMTLPNSHLDRKPSIYAGILVLGISLASLAVAVTPLIHSLEDYFVQAMFYDPDYKLFLGFPNKVKHVKVLQAYYNTSNITTEITWKEIGEKVNGMFSNQYGLLSRYPVHFYGNDGVCLFKYFVRSDDARRSRQVSDTGAGITDRKGDVVVWLMLAVNLICFIIITVSYVVLNVSRRKYSKKVGQGRNRNTLKQNQKLQRRISMIIVTDFLCWVPFIVISGLHNLKAIDASEWYVYFAMTVLPFNSVSNPLIYDDFFRKFFQRKVKDINEFLRNSGYVNIVTEARTGRISFLTRTVETTELETRDKTISHRKSLMPHSGDEEDSKML